MSVYDTWSDSYEGSDYVGINFSPCIDKIVVNKEPDPVEDADDSLEDSVAVDEDSEEDSDVAAEDSVDEGED